MYLKLRTQKMYKLMLKTHPTGIMGTWETTTWLSTSNKHLEGLV
jgi:hypothetical protein